MTEKSGHLVPKMHIGRRGGPDVWAAECTWPARESGQAVVDAESGW